jgi:outer membrane protein OmpA-like peptidoglycan-associated protein
VPIATPAFFPSTTGLSLSILMMLSIDVSPALAGTQHYQAPLDSVRWEASSEKLHCSLKHDIPLYGQAIFAQSAGEKLGFTMKVKRKATRDKDSAHLRAMPPEWKHQISVVDLGNVPVIKGGAPFQFGEDLSRRMLAELQKGMFPTFSYRDWADARDQVTVGLPGINIKQALDEFIGCLSSLPVYTFADFENSQLHFAFGKHTLTDKDRTRLDAVARYLKSDPEIKRIEIYGHTDNIGRKRNNDKLGQRRSETVKQYLLSKGIADRKFTIKSYGERKPKTSNSTNKGRASNRRVVVILAK